MTCLLYTSIGSGGREFLIDIYYDLCKALGKNIEPKFGPPRKGDVRDSNADITKAREKLGYDPDYDFASGIPVSYTHLSDIKNTPEDMERIIGLVRGLFA